jgi:hypothetical protein
VKEIEAFISESLLVGAERTAGVADWSSFIGKGPNSYDLGYSAGEQNSGYAHMLINTLDSETFSPSASAFLFAIYSPKLLLILVGAGAFIGLAVRDWRGNVQRMLLLRLLDAHQKETDRDENVG